MSNPLLIERQPIAAITASVLNVTLTMANTEYSFDIPSYSRALSLKTRNSAHSVKLTFAANQSASTYFSLSGGDAWNETMILPVDLTVYCQSPDAGCILEIVVWS